VIGSPADEDGAADLERLVRVGKHLSAVSDPATEAANETFLKSLPDVTVEVGDAAMVERLTPQDAAGLADGAAARERALSQIAEQIRPEPGYQMNLDPVRQPIADLASTDLQTPHLERVRLIKTTPTRPLNESPQEQQDTLISLGIELPNSVVVHTMSWLPTTSLRVWETRWSPPASQPIYQVGEHGRYSYRSGPPGPRTRP
jgi:hypothetical protein